MHKSVRSKTVLFAVLAAVVFFAPMFVQAQTGCTSSPENPSGLLLLVGAAGYGASALREKLRRKK